MTSTAAFAAYLSANIDARYHDIAPTEAGEAGDLARHYLATGDDEALAAYLATSIENPRDFGSLLTVIRMHDRRGCGRESALLFVEEVLAGAPTEAFHLVVGRLLVEFFSLAEDLGLTASPSTTASDLAALCDLSDAEAVTLLDVPRVRTALLFHEARGWQTSLDALRSAVGDAKIERAKARPSRPNVSKPMFIFIQRDGTTARLMNEFGFSKPFIAFAFTEAGALDVLRTEKPNANPDWIDDLTPVMIGRYLGEEDASIPDVEADSVDYDSDGWVDAYEGTPVLGAAEHAGLDRREWLDEMNPSRPA